MLSPNPNSRRSVKSATTGALVVWQKKKNCVVLFLFSFALLFLRRCGGCNLLSKRSVYSRRLSREATLSVCKVLLILFQRFFRSPLWFLSDPVSFPLSFGFQFYFPSFFHRFYVTSSLSSARVFRFHARLPPICFHRVFFGLFVLLRSFLYRSLAYYCRCIILSCSLVSLIIFVRLAFWSLDQLWFTSPLRTVICRSFSEVAWIFCPGHMYLCGTLCAEWRCL